MTESKKCYSCNEIKPLSEYHKRSDRPDGLTQSCKTCNRMRRRNHYANNNKKIVLTYAQHTFLFNMIHTTIDQLENKEKVNVSYLNMLHEISKKLI